MSRDRILKSCVPRTSPIVYDKEKKRIELENFSSEPVRLTKVHQNK